MDALTKGKLQELVRSSSPHIAIRPPEKKRTKEEVCYFISQ